MDVDESGKQAEDLNRWFDGELPSEEGSRVERAMRERPDLADEARFLEAVRQTVRGRERIRASSGMSARILEAVLPGAAEPVWILVEPLVKRLAVAASILLLASLALGVIFSAPPRERGGAGPIRISAVERALLGDAELNATGAPSGTPTGADAR
jgi:anti-sigma factor RsiW